MWATSPGGLGLWYLSLRQHRTTRQHARWRTSTSTTHPLRANRHTGELMSEPRLLHVGDLYALRPDLEPRWRVTAVLNRGRSYDEVLLIHLTDPTLTSRARVYHPGLNPTDLTLPALVHLLDRAYRADQRKFKSSSLTEEDRRRLADDLACHDLVR